MSDREIKPLLLLGTRTFAEEMADVISDVPGFRVAGFVENMDRHRCDQLISGLPIHWIDDLAPLAATHWAVGALSTTHRGRFIDQAAALGMRFATVVHPSANLSGRVTLGEGCFINRGVLIAGFTQLGRHVLINRGAIIGHHTSIGDLCTIQPGANVAGACEIGRRVYIGMSACVIDHVKVGEQAVLGAGAVAIADVPPRTLSVGVPAKVVKQDIDGK